MMPLPAPITLMRDGIVVSEAMADPMREDLLRSGIGDGRHESQFDPRNKNFDRDSPVAVRIGGRQFALVNSGMTVAELGGQTPTSLPPRCKTHKSLLPSPLLLFSDGPNDADNAW